MDARSTSIGLREVATQLSGAVAALAGCGSHWHCCARHHPQPFIRSASSKTPAAMAWRPMEQSVNTEDSSTVLHLIDDSPPRLLCRSVKPPTHRIQRLDRWRRYRESIPRGHKRCSLAVTVPLFSHRVNALLRAHFTAKHA